MNNVSRTSDELVGVTLLGNQNTKYSDDYNPEVLETFDNKHPDNDYVVTFDAYEFTSKCVVGDTLISTWQSFKDGGIPALVPIKDMVGTEGMLLGFDEQSNTAVPKRYHDVRKTYSQVPVVKVVFSVPEGDGVTSVRCTPDHLVLVRIADKEFKWVQAKDLTPGSCVVDNGTDQCPKVISVADDGVADVYNLEVEDVHNFFGNGVVLHNCPKTGQPDFAKVVISYIPDKKMVESKSLKLYLFSFRNHGDFHEDCMNIIMKDLVKLMDPKYLEVRGIFSPRGGISIFPMANYAKSEKYEAIAEQRKLDVLRDAANRSVRYDS